MKSEQDIITTDIGIYKMEFRAIDEIVLPSYTGSAWRGLFGRGLKKTLCPVAHTKCPECLLKTTCSYIFLFENNLQNNFKKYSANPYILNAPVKDKTKIIKKNEVFHLNFNLFGKANIFIPAIINAFLIAGRTGFKQQKFTPINLYNLNQEQTTTTIIWQQHQNLQKFKIPKIITPKIKSTDIKIIFLTPQRYKHHNHLVDIDNFNFNNWFLSALNRINSIKAIFSPNPELIDLKKIINTIKDIKPISLKIKKQNIIRYSSRQKTTMNLDGIVGEMILKSADIQQIWQYLHLSQFINIGKSTTMGLGRVCIIKN
jgi:hypothetical protein